MTTALRCSDNRIQQTAVNKWWRAYEKCCKGDNSCSVNSNDFCFTLSPETPCETSVIFPLFEKIMTRKRWGKWTIVAMKWTNPAFSRYEQSAPLILHSGSDVHVTLLLQVGNTQVSQPQLRHPAVYLRMRISEGCFGPESRSWCTLPHYGLVCSRLCCRHLCHRKDTDLK